MHDYSVRRVFTAREYAKQYDVNVLALFHYFAQYKDRVDWFKRFGLLNTAGSRIHVMAVCSTGDGEFAEEIAAGWSPGIDVTVLEVASQHPVPKINGAYLWLRNQPLRARWQLRVDDDSVTDIGRLLASQEARFGSAAVHLMSTPNAVPAADQLTAEIRRYLVDKGYTPHSMLNEYEASLTSEAAMRRIYSSEAALEFLADMARQHGGPGDKCLAHAARIASVPTATAHGMYYQFHHDNMSITGGDNTHIHYVDWRNNRFTEMLDALVYGKQEPLDRDVLNAVVGRTLEFGRCVGYPLARLTVRSDGTIPDALADSESRWRIVEDEFWLQSQSGAPTTAFNRMLIGKEKRWIIGPHFESIRMHYLGPI